MGGEKSFFLVQNQRYISNLDRKLGNYECTKVLSLQVAKLESENGVDCSAECRDKADFVEYFYFLQFFLGCECIQVNQT